jgi:hypothetical protein
VRSDPGCSHVVAGRAGGKLKSPGVHHREPGANSNQVLLTLLRAVGLPLGDYGAAGSLTAGCSAIEA